MVKVHQPYASHTITFETDEEFSMFWDIIDSEALRDLLTYKQNDLLNDISNGFSMPEKD